MIYQFDRATENAIKNGDIPFLLQQLNDKPPCDFVYNLSHYLNGACNFGSHDTLKELLKLHKKHSNFDLTRGIVQHYLGGRAYSDLMSLSVKNHHNDCLRTLFEYIKPHNYWGQCTALVTQCIQYAVSANNSKAIKIAVDFEKDCTPPEHYTVSNEIDLWWPRLQNKSKTQAKQVVQYMDKTLVNHILVWRLHARSEHKGALEALIERCNPKKVTTLISKTNLPPVCQIGPKDMKWLEDKLIAHQKAVLNKAVHGAKTAPRAQRKI